MSVDTKGNYNAAEYNETLYNDNDLFLSLSEAINSADDSTKSDSIVKAELVTLIDNLQKYFNGTIFNEMILASDTRLMSSAKVLLELIPITDTFAVSFIKSLPESLTLNDFRNFVQSRSLNEFILLVDALSKQITNKQLPAESLRLNDWLEIRNAPYSDPWN